MADIRIEFVTAAINRVVALSDYDNDFDKVYEFQKQTILDDESLTIDEKTKATEFLAVLFDYQKVLLNKGSKRICENCSMECLATLFCEFCVRTYLKNNFSNWSSGNNDIDNLIQQCQIETISTNNIIEWIPYNNLQDIKYMTKGGCSEIYTAIWINGRFNEWDSKEKQLRRGGSIKVILKKLENIENANRSWIDEAKSHLTLGNKHALIIKCFGLTQDPSNGDYMLVMNLMDMDLRKYLQHQRTWKEKIIVVYKIIAAIYFIHKNNAIHRDLHSGNILSIGSEWCISDFGFCGPADKPLKSIYGNLPYIAPEVIIGRENTFASDIYSFGILMWEISSGQTPFNNYEHNYDLAMKIVDGMRPKITSAGVPPEYNKLMKQCWDADPLKRPDIDTLLVLITEMWEDSYNEYTNEFNNTESDNSSQISQTNSSLSSLSTSKLHQFENLPEPKNASEEQEAFYSKTYDLTIPDFL
ncbi:kinase-like domain-containing protein [Glomus cerebriforme]|uniref:Kinase-like domain-containing protein n=1 Tax=Glomus cerebriforme TaxID=658196 RepID=A0A397T4J5_9GLOM|nr:kinase-like domain-containing protein [Glomus cerebriforme]